MTNKKLISNREIVISGIPLSRMYTNHLKSKADEFLNITRWFKRLKDEKKDVKRAEIIAAIGSMRYQIDCVERVLGL